MENRFNNLGVEEDQMNFEEARVEEMSPQNGGQLDLDDFKKKLEKDGYEDAMNNINSYPENEIGPGFERSLDAYIANQNPEIRDPQISQQNPQIHNPEILGQPLEQTAQKPILPEQLEKAENTKLRGNIAEYGEINNLSYQVNEVLDMLSIGIEEALEQAQKYRNLSSKDKFVGIPVYSSLKKVRESKKFKKLMHSIETTYMKLPENMRNARYASLLNNDKISQKYGKGDKLEAAGEAVGTAGIGVAVAGYAGLATNIAANTIAPGIGAAAVMGGGVLTSLVGGAMASIGRFKTIDSDYDLDKAIHELGALHKEVYNHKNGIPTGGYQELYVNRGLTNMETMMSGGARGSLAVGMAGGVVGGMMAD